MFSKEEYQRYINSPTWKQKRAAALERAQYRCEKCGFSKWSRVLDVHHLTYERFQREIPSDLMVLCKECHEIEDKKRARRGRQRSADALYEAQLHGWAVKVYGEDWAEREELEQVEERFLEWREKRAAW